MPLWSPKTLPILHFLSFPLEQREPLIFNLRKAGSGGIHLGESLSFCLCVLYVLRTSKNRNVQVRPWVKVSWVGLDFFHLENRSAQVAAISPQAFADSVFEEILRKHLELTWVAPSVLMVIFLKYEYYIGSMALSKKSNIFCLWLGEKLTLLDRFFSHFSCYIGVDGWNTFCWVILEEFRCNLKDRWISINSLKFSAYLVVILEVMDVKPFFELC